MTRPRSALISIEATPYYHCISRCVRRAFLCGKDKSGKNFNHRKQWLVDRIKLLADVFAVNVAAYAVMSNHYHLVLHIDKPSADSWDEQEVLSRWNMLYRGPDLLQRRMAGEELAEYELKELSRLTAIWRSRLTSISWFMSCLNFVIALQANKEDGCTGRFWEGRFKSQALKDETALIACMAYVDLNPVRAGIAQDLPGSEYTSIRDRIRQAQRKGKRNKSNPKLLTFGEVETQNHNRNIVLLPYSFKDYLELVGWQGRSYHSKKRGAIPKAVPKLLSRFNLSESEWQYLSRLIQKESSTMLDGLLNVEKFKVKQAKAG